LLPSAICPLPSAFFLPFYFLLPSALINETKEINFNLYNEKSYAVGWLMRLGMLEESYDD